jgi:hypothetical protein
MVKGAKLEDLKDALVIWIWQVYTQNGTKTYKVVKEQANLHGQQVSVTNFANNFAPKNEIIVKMSKPTA